jgi:hypothetical protein
MEKKTMTQIRSRSTPRSPVASVNAPRFRLERVVGVVAP